MNWKISNEFMNKKIDELIYLTKENNKMLRQIIRYLNYISLNSENENNNDFIRNVIANIVSNRLPQIRSGK